MKNVTLGTLNVNDIFIYAGIKFTVSYTPKGTEGCKDDYLLAVRIGDTEKYCQLTNLTVVQVF